MIYLVSKYIIQVTYMNVYDFDKTIYYYDSTKRFYKFLLKKYPKMALRGPVQLAAFIKYHAKITDKTAMKEVVYSAFRYVPDMEAQVEIFWDGEIKNIKEWYLKQQKEDDLIISASPEFLIFPICKRLGIKNVIASKADMKTGKYTGKNCYGEEKVVRMLSEVGHTHIDEFYSDSYSDSPLAKLADKAYLVQRDELKDW